MHNILLKIIEKKKQDLIEQMQHVPLEQLQKKMIDSSEENLFKKNILEKKDIAIIAEIKLASPKKSFLGEKGSVLERAKKYEESGVDTISIITEKNFFNGDVAFVTDVKKEVMLPILQKDFVIDAYQIYEAKSIGSDSLLFIAKFLNPQALSSFVNICKKLNIEPVVEINDEEDLEKAVATSTSIIAVNARDLETFRVDVDIACRLMKKIPDKFIKLGFSGISSSSEVGKYKKAGAKGVLVGTSLMRAENITDFIKSLKV